MKLAVDMLFCAIIMLSGETILWSKISKDARMWRMHFINTQDSKRT